MTTQNENEFDLKLDKRTMHKSVIYNIEKMGINYGLLIIDKHAIDNHMSKIIIQ